MTELLEQAIAQLRNLDADKQDAIASPNYRMLARSLAFAGSTELQ
jgi:hypothetical protein